MRNAYKILVEILKRRDQLRTKASRVEYYLKVLLRKDMHYINPVQDRSEGRLL
jgi:hypothetical protein